MKEQLPRYKKGADAERRIQDSARIARLMEVQKEIMYLESIMQDELQRGERLSSEGKAKLERLQAEEILLMGKAGQVIASVKSEIAHLESVRRGKRRLSKEERQRLNYLYHVLELFEAVESEDEEERGPGHER